MIRKHSKELTVVEALVAGTAVRMVVSLVVQLNLQRLEIRISLSSTDLTIF